MKAVDSKRLKNIAIRIDASTHKRAKTKLADQDSSFQQFVANSIAAFVNDGKMPPADMPCEDEILAKKLLHWARNPKNETHEILAKMVISEAERMK